MISPLIESVSTFHYQTLSVIIPSFIQQLFIEYLLYTSHSSRDLEIWGWTKKVQFLIVWRLVFGVRKPLDKKFTY